jgi:hypothetical protein
MRPAATRSNTGVDAFWELELKLFNDRRMSPALLREGFLQIGQPFLGQYDPICFNCRPPEREKPILQLDHEEILCNDRITIVKQISPSFLNFCRAYSVIDRSKRESARDDRGKSTTNRFLRPVGPPFTRAGYGATAACPSAVKRYNAERRSFAPDTLPVDVLPCRAILPRSRTAELERQRRWISSTRARPARP